MTTADLATIAANRAGKPNARGFVPLWKGKAPRTNGKVLESLVLASPGVTLTKIPNGVQWLPGGEKRITKSPCDFMGCFSPVGRLVVFDAKECALKGGFPVGRSETLKPHQRAELLKYGRAGAIAGLLVLASATGRVYWLDWRELVELPKSYPWDAIEMRYVGPFSALIGWGRVLLAEQCAKYRDAMPADGVTPRIGTFGPDYSALALRREAAASVRIDQGDVQTRCEPEAKP